MKLARGSRAVVVTDHTRFGRQGLVQVCGFGGFAELATDRRPPPEIAAALDATGARLLIAGAERGTGSAEQD